MVAVPPTATANIFSQLRFAPIEDRRVVGDSLSRFGALITGLPAFARFPAALLVTQWWDYVVYSGLLTRSSATSMKSSTSMATPMQLTVPQNAHVSASYGNLE